MCFCAVPPPHPPFSHFRHDTTGSGIGSALPSTTTRLAAGPPCAISLSVRARPSFPLFLQENCFRASPSPHVSCFQIQFSALPSPPPPEPLSKQEARMNTFPFSKWNLPICLLFFPRSIWGTVKRKELLFLRTILMYLIKGSSESSLGLVSHGKGRRGGESPLFVPMGGRRPPRNSPSSSSLLFCSFSQFSRRGRIMKHENSALRKGRKNFEF